MSENGTGNGLCLNTHLLDYRVGVELGQAGEVILPQIVRHVKAHSGENQMLCAGGEQPAIQHADIKLIHLFQQAFIPHGQQLGKQSVHLTVNGLLQDDEQCRGEVACRPFQFQPIRQFVQHLRFPQGAHLPELRHGSAAGIRHVKYIPQGAALAIVAQKRDAAGTRLDAAAHASVPQLQ